MRYLGRESARLAEEAPAIGLGDLRLCGMAPEGALHSADARPAERAGLRPLLK
jgi:hypothetical protein